MTRQARKIIAATMGLVGLFAIYETIKTLLFPAMSATTSHVVSTLVVGGITVIISRYVVQQQSSLHSELEASNRRLREALTASSRNEILLRSIVESIDEGLVIIDRDSRLLLINDAARRLLQTGTRSGERLAEISRDPGFHRVFANVLTLEDRAEARLEARGLDGAAQNRRILRVQAAPLRMMSGEVEGVVGVISDLSKLEMLERVRQEFLSNVSHELRTPLASIVAFVETLIDGGIEDEENCLRFLNTIHRNTARMQALVNDISELSAIESGSVTLKPTRLPLNSLVSEVFTGLEPRASQFGVWLENRVGAEVELDADRYRLEQILINLIDNAIKFNHPGGRVIVSAEVTDEGRCRMTVKDTWPGIGPEHLTRVFERFYRVDKARSREAGGTGLGLAIVKHLTLAHGGEAFARSEVGVGSEFIISLPLRSLPTAPAAGSLPDHTGSAITRH